MQENNFERQVQQKAGELKISPSEDVWQKVLIAITKRKSNRRVVVILLFLLLFISSSIFLIFNQRPGTIIKQSISKNIKEGKTDSGNQPLTVQNNSASAKKQVKSLNSKNETQADESKIIKDITKKSSGTRLKIIKSHPAIKTAIVASTIEAGSEDNNAEVPGLSLTKTKKLQSKGKQHLHISITGSEPSYPSKDLNTDNNNDNTIAAKEKEILSAIPGIEKADAKTRVIDSAGITKTIIAEHAKDTLTVVTKSDDKKATAVKKLPQSKWKLGINVSIGITATKNGYFGAIGLGNEDKSFLNSFPNQSTGGNNTGGNNPGGISYPVSTNMNAGPGIVLGAFLQKKLSPRTNFLVGINFKEYTTVMKIGNRLDTNLTNFPVLYLDNSYYANGSQNHYKNHFYFLELPFAIQINLNKQKSKPLYFTAGIAVAQLIGSNALQFDVQNGIYYNKNDLFNKTQLSLSAGLLFALSKNLQNPLLLGPDINFSLNKMANTGIYQDRHYSYFGIHLQKNITN